MSPEFLDGVIPEIENRRVAGARIVVLDGSAGCLLVRKTK